jgi:putative transposase
LHPPGTQHAGIPQQPFLSPSNTVGAIIRGFKGATTRQIRESLKLDTLIVWQRSFHEHVIRGEEELDKIRTYIHHNAQTWAADKYHSD